MTFHRATMDAPFGSLTVVASDAGVRYVMFDHDAHPKPLDVIEIVDSGHPVLDEACSQLDQYLAGTRTEFDLPLDLKGTEFQVTAWRALSRIPFGRTASYAEQAASIGRPTATRAVGSANGRNPVAVVLPCHRVVGSDGSLTGFGGGLGVKQWLLDHERRVIDSIG